LASNRGDDEPGQPIAIGGTGVAQRRSNDMTAIVTLSPFAQRIECSQRTPFNRRGAELNYQ
jgi:hypothetical protein